MGGRRRGIKDVIGMTEEEWLEEAAKHGYGSDSETDSDSESQTDSDSEESGSEESAADEEKILDLIKMKKSQNCCQQVKLCSSFVVLKVQHAPSLKVMKVQEGVNSK